MTFEHNIQFTHVLALYDPFGVDVPLNFDITHSLTHNIPVYQLHKKLKIFNMLNVYVVYVKNCKQETRVNIQTTVYQKSCVCLHEIVPHG